MLRIKGVAELNPEDRTLSGAAVAMNFVPRRKLEAALQSFSATPAESRPSLGAFLIGRKILTPREVALLSEYPAKRILRCSACPQEFDVTSVEPGSQFECPLCGVLVTVPSVSTHIDVSEPDEKDLIVPAEVDFVPPVIEALEPDDVSKELEKQGYRVISQLGRGGMGIVFLAEDLKLRRRVALKLLLTGGLASDAQVERFDREAKAVAALKHPNIVSIHSLGTIKGQRYYVMDYVEGMALDQAISSNALNAVTAARICSDICDAVHHAHQAGVIHRDLKPANILLDREMTPFVTDFGLAKTDDASKYITESGIALGTPHYMSPEQASGNVSSIDQRSDIYAIGVILYEMLCGRVPFEGSRSVDIMMKVIHDDPEPPSSFAKGIPDELEAICLKAMSKSPESRYQSAREMADDIEAFLSGRTVLAKPPSPIRKVGRALKKVRVLVSLFLVIIATAMVSFYWQDLVRMPVDEHAPMIENLDAAILSCDEGRLGDALNILAISQNYPADDPRVVQKSEALKEKLKTAYRNTYEATTDMTKKAEALLPLLQYFEGDSVTNELIGRFRASLERVVKESSREGKANPQEVVSILGNISSTLGRWASIISDVRASFVSQLEKDAEAYLKEDSRDKAIECLQVLSLLHPEEETYQRKIAEVRASQYDDIWKLLTSITKHIGYGSISLKGAIEDCVVEVASVTDENSKISFDTRVQTSIPLQNGFYTLTLTRSGFKPIVRNVAVEADKDLAVTVREDEWVRE
ncbi:MAG: hypothetical protein Kow00107_05730 [Planctomycetota bacterium]